jgi:hypothetical protein
LPTSLDNDVTVVDAIISVVEDADPIGGYDDVTIRTVERRVFSRVVVVVVVVVVAVASVATSVSISISISSNSLSTLFAKRLTCNDPLPLDEPAPKPTVSIIVL